ncbi:MAG: glycosyltransferase [Streptomyces sp.]|uniref:glycosyltransferase n=1 Tax=Streptomyces sp. TaxID=1931 RepID=UPI0025F2B94E|nr:glycosyltransferase [Streptomyces sp.]MBW8799052.1 glycosyltransferase [Streptomyces sp.]
MLHLGSTVYLRALAAAALSPRRAAAPRRTAPAERVVIVSASIGAGHDGAAHELHRRLRAEGVTVDRYDLLDLLPARTGRVVRDGYHRMLVRAPWVYQRIYSSTERAGGGGPLARALLRTAEDRMLRALPADTGAVVSTYPGASRVLGRLRLAGRLDVPVFTYLTDFSVHPLWVADGVDVHLAAHAVPAAQARALGAGDVRVGGPVVDPRFRPAQAGERSAARARFGLPATAPLALLVAGSWGVGPVRQVALELQGCGAAVPVVVCGRNEALARQLREDGIEHAFGWVDDMPGLMHAADVLVQNAGGLTSLEAFAAGLPVASYRCIPGHGPANAAALDEAGVAAWIQDAAELKDVLCDLIGGPRGLLQREAGLALFAAAGRGPADAIARACGPRDPLPVPLAVAASGVRGAGAGAGVAPCAVRGAGAGAGVAPCGVCGAGAGAGVAPCAAGGTGARPAVAPSAAERIRTRPALRRLAAAAAAACTVWACAVGTGVATTDTGTGVMHAIGRTLDLDRPPHAHHPEGHRS